MEAVMETVDNREEKPDKVSNKIKGREELRAKEPAVETRLDVQHDSKDTSPLLHLPGEIRNEIYGYLTVESEVEIRYIPEEDLASANVDFIYSQEHQALSQINRQIRQEARSYILDHCIFLVDYKDLIGYGIHMGDARDCFRNLAVDLRHLDANIDEDDRCIVVPCTLPYILEPRKLLKTLLST
ncbi:hypothetical protein B5807_05888 [Epicoccum nigrum]|uniref:F-box domain-containing protein n=1 Tax=Epicoccum nigrum TaxID=105696 RepID=A0A1Y2M0E0_EPING|nr:hypothetical protein B5807_05888 [Epicoccum nigrum]